MNRISRVASAVLLVFALSLLAYAAYDLLLPDPKALTLQENMQIVRKAMNGEATKESFDKALANMDDDMLFSVVAEAAYEYEKAGVPEAIISFNDAFTSRITPGITPKMLYNIIVGDYPSWFKIYTLQGVNYTHGKAYNGAQRFGSEYSEVLQKALWLPEVRADDHLVSDILLTIPWSFDNTQTEVLYDLYHTSDEQSKTSIFALREIEALDPSMVKDELFSFMERYWEIDESVLMSNFYSLARLSQSNPELEEEIAKRMFDFLEQYMASEPVFSDDFTNCIVTTTGITFGWAHRKGLVAYVMENQQKLPDLEYAILALSEYLYPEVNEMLLSQNEQEVQWALTWVRMQPYEYYLHNLKLMNATTDGAKKQVSELITICQSDPAYLPLPEIGMEVSHEKETD